MPHTISVMADKLKFIIAALWQLSYGIIQSFIGLLVFIFYVRCPHFIYRCGIITVWRRRDGVSLGLFAFVPDTENEGLKEHMIRHEYGHSIQSMILGPLYLPVVGIPSLCWNAMPVLQHFRSRKGVEYERFYTESWANRLGGTRCWW